MADIITGTVTGSVDNTKDLILSGVADLRRELANESTGIQLENMKGFDRVNADVLRSAASGTLENMKGFDRVNADILRTGADGRYSGAQNTSEIIKEGLKESFAARGDIKDTRYDIASRIEQGTDRVTDQSTQYYIASAQNANEAARDLAGLKVLTDANTSRISAELSLGIEKAAAATALESAKVGAAVALESARLGTAVALGQATLSKEIFADGQKTRDLMNDLKYHDLNRGLIERNAELVEERHERRHYRGLADQYQSQGQWASVQAQLQAFQSQLQTATQGTVNFGTMSGNAGRNTSTNNVV